MFFGLISLFWVILISWFLVDGSGNLMVTYTVCYVSSASPDTPELPLPSKVGRWPDFIMSSTRFLFLGG